MCFDIDKCANLFKKDKRYNIIFEKFKKKIISNNKIEGKIIIRNPTIDEKNAIESLFYKKNFKGESFSFSVEEFKIELERLGFFNIDLKELTDKYYNKKILSKSEKIEKQNIAIEKFFKELRERFERNEIQEEFVSKYINIIKENYFDVGKLKEKEEEIQKLYFCGMAIFDRITANDFIKIAFLSEKITRNPHYFDKGNKGSLLIKLLKIFNNIDIDDDLTETEKAQEVLYQSKIEINTISNYVTAYGIKLFNSNGEIKAYNEFIKDKLIYNIPLEHLKDVIKVECINKNIFIVENEMVFVRIYEHFKNDNISIICTSGQLRLASLILIELLSQKSYNIYYSGDIDPEGIGILNRVIKKSNNKVIPWKMDLKTYLNHEKNKDLISESSLKKLDSILDIRFQELINSIKSDKRACYQESFLEEMIKDIEKLKEKE